MKMTVHSEPLSPESKAGKDLEPLGSHLSRKNLAA